MLCMARTLGEFIKEKREEAGLNQSDLARSSGVLRETINRIENNKTMLPSADSRRRLAKALGVSHLELLIAAGEILPEEVRAAGAEGVIERDPDPMTDELVTLARLIDWRQAPGIFTGLSNVLAGVLEDQRGARARASGASDRA